MTATTEPPPSGESDAPASAQNSPSQRKPRLSLFIATACGLGYLPNAPGTWGSLAGLFLAVLPYAAFLISARITGGVGVEATTIHGGFIDPFLVLQGSITLVIAAIGVWTATRAANFWQVKDPQRVVIDEVSGQHLAILLACDISFFKSIQISGQTVRMQPIPFESALNWKYLVLGFILFRVFDIWKPFPARQAESLPGGWGIMADDWIAGIYAAIGLWLARGAGL
jgi:phosphatidylglycerophosphatase A